MEQFDGTELRELIEANSVRLENMRVQSIAQHDELIAVLQKLTKATQRQLEISEGYQKLIATPLENGLYAISLLKTAIAYIIGIGLSFWGVKEIFDFYFVPRAKP